MLARCSSSNTNRRVRQPASMASAVGSKRERDKEALAPKPDDNLVNLAMDLINCESLSGHEQPMSTMLKAWLEQRDWIVELQEVAPQKSTVDGKPRHNLYARRAVIPVARIGGPRVLFNSHIDTVRLRDIVLRRYTVISVC